MSKSATKVARRLWRGFRLPEDAGGMLSEPRYHTEEFCRLYLEGCAELILESPAEGLVAARFGPPLALKLPPSPGRADLQVRALALLGSAHLANGQLFAAASTFPLALEVAERETVSPAMRADLHRRRAALLARQERFGEAEAALRQALDLLEDIAPGDGDFHPGAVVLERGELRLVQRFYGEAIDDFGLALAQLDPRRNERAYFAAARSLAAALDLAPELAFVNQATRWLRFARVRQKGQRASLARFALYAIEAEVLAKVGSTRRAQKNLQIARRGFERIGARRQLALASLQLAFLLHGEGRFEELRRLSAETASSFSRAGGAELDADALALLERWRDAAAAAPAELAPLAATDRELRALFAIPGRPAPFGGPPRM